MARPIPIALVGRPNVLATCALEAPAGGVEAVRVSVSGDSGADEAASAIAGGGFEAVVAFEPEALPGGLVADWDVPTIGWTTLDASSGFRGVDRVIVTGAAPPGSGVWRSLAFPVADSGFGPARPRGAPPRGLWLCGDTARRREYLSHFEPSVEVAVVEGDLSEGLAATDIGVNLHDRPGRALHHEAARSLAAGQLLVSEPLDPARGLEPGIDFIEAPELGDVHLAIEAAGADLGAFQRIRLRGRLKAERFRASAVYPKLVGDLLEDLRVFGR